MKKTILQLDKAEFADKKVLVRVDFNVPLNDQGTIMDETRIRAAIPTINYLRKAGAKIILMSHLGRSKGKSDKLTLKPIADKLRQLLTESGKGRVLFANDCVGAAAQAVVGQLHAGDVCLLENVRFHEEEESNDPAFAKQLASLGDMYVNDAFGTAHRAHASTEGVTHFLRPALAGLLLESEIRMLSETLDNPARPFATIIGGAKVSSKIGVLDRLLSRADVIVIGGAMAFTFLKARGLEIGKSLVEDDQLNYCLDMENKAKQQNVQLILPLDVVCAKEIKPGVERTVVDARHIPANMMGLDLGKKSMAQIFSVLKSCKTILWNGPLGVFEIEGFEEGTFALIDELVKLARNGTKVVVGGGDSVSALNERGIEETELTHVSTGGGASLEFIEGLELPGIACLDEVESKTAAAL